MRIMAIDYGDAHTGIAISDPTGFLAGFTTTINAYRPEVVAEQIAALAKEHGVEELVLGHPINMDGTRGPRSEKAQAMKALLEETTETLLQYDNAELQFFMADIDVITNLDNYADHIHVAGRVTYRMAQAMPSGEYRLTAENRAEVLDGLRDFVVHYDYDEIWK